MPPSLSFSSAKVVWGQSLKIKVLNKKTTKLLKIFLKSNKNLSSHTLTWRLETQAAGVTFSTGPTIVGTQSGAGCTNSSITNYDFTSIRLPILEDQFEGDQKDFLINLLRSITENFKRLSGMNTEFYLEVAKGNIPGHSIVNKFGHNSLITTATDPVDVWYPLK